MVSFISSFIKKCGFIKLFEVVLGVWIYDS